MGVWFNGVMAYGKLTTQIDPKLHEETRLEALKRGTTMRALIEEGLRLVVKPLDEKVPVTIQEHDETKNRVNILSEKEYFNPQPKRKKK